MAEMFDTKRLEYNKVLRMLSNFCVSEYSKERVQVLSPTGSVERIEHLFDLVVELKRAIEKECIFTQPSFHSIGDCLDRAAVQRSALQIEDFLIIRENLLAASTLKRQCKSFKNEVPLLYAGMQEVVIPADLLSAIDRSIDAHGAVKKDASDRLEEIHGNLKNVRSRIENLLGLYLNDPEMKRFFRERHITLKDDRYVIPLKQDFKGRIPGVIHAHSGSDRTVFVEPFSVVDSNNEIRRLQKEREREIHRILVSLTTAVRGQSKALQAIQDALADFDILMAKCRFMVEYSCSIPEYVEEKQVELRSARHPLIGKEAVPIDIDMGGEMTAVVITGPNTGGKTVALKTLGLLVILGQSGIPVPAASMRSCVFNGVFSDIGDESSIEQSLSTFSAHIKNIQEITRKADDRSLVLIDELGAGTDPTEGGALGAAILDFLMDRKVMTVVTTHFSFIKMHALERNDAQVASVEFDPVTCRPTYRLVMGVPGRSNALEVAQNLGLKPEILDRSRKYVGDETQSMDGIIKKLTDMERELAIREQDVVERQGELDGLLEDYREELGRLRAREKALDSDMRQEFGRLLKDYRKRLEQSIKRIREEEGSRSSILAGRKDMDEIHDNFNDLLEGIEREGVKGIEEEEEKTAGDIEIGDLVTVETSKGGSVEGKVVQLTGERVTLLAGSLRLTADLDRVQRVVRSGGESSQTWDFTSEQSRPRVYECDVRGMRFEEAMDEVNRFIDNAVLNNLETVTIIHGLGTGVLREGVQNVLKAHRDVSQVHYARPEQGGYGCTIVQLRV
jgi:DNA mismatch repair protein MutS2